MRRKKPPPTWSMVLLAIRYGVSTTCRISELVGVSPAQASQEVYMLAKRNLVRRVRREGAGKRGRPRWVWEANEPLTIQGYSIAQSEAHDANLSALS